MKDINYKEIKLKVGLEIHQQLATNHKLFCNCGINNLENDSNSIKFMRKFKPTQSELGQFDTAAIFEFHKNIISTYIADNSNSCLVESDEEPPHELNQEALDIALTICLLLKSNIIDELHTMRKMVIDGSNTAGFQRTVIISTDGELQHKNNKIPILAINLEEDAAKIIKKTGNKANYNLNRLGVPLIEIALAPVETNPKEIEHIALSLGQLLRSTGKVSRGIGTIRQDVNISILNGPVIEIKGVQKLESMSDIIDYEAKRQYSLNLLMKDIKNRNINSSNIEFKIEELREIFQNSENKIIRDNLNKNGVILGLKVSNFKGLLNKEYFQGIKLGKEIAEIAKTLGFGGIFHSDELPNYKITEGEVNKINKKLSCSENDSFILITGTSKNINNALNSIKNRIIQAINEIPEETRSPTVDNKTKFIRPRPGKARMYPETDITLVIIENNRISRLKSELPEPYHKQIDNFKNKYNLNNKLTNQIFDSKNRKLFEIITNKTNIDTNLIVIVLTEIFVSMERNKIDVKNISEEKIIEVFKLLENKSIAKEALENVFTTLANEKELKVKDVTERLNLKKINKQQLEEIIDEIIRDKKELIIEKREYAFKIIMGIVMEKVRGKIDGKEVSEIIARKIRDVK